MREEGNQESGNRSSKIFETSIYLQSQKILLPSKVFDISATFISNIGEYLMAHRTTCPLSSLFAASLMMYRFSPETEQNENVVILNEMFPSI